MSRTYCPEASLSRKEVLRSYQDTFLESGRSPTKKGMLKIRKEANKEGRIQDGIRRLVKNLKGLETSLVSLKNHIEHGNVAGAAHILPKDPGSARVS